MPFPALVIILFAFALTGRLFAPYPFRLLVGVCIVGLAVAGIAGDILLARIKRLQEWNVIIWSFRPLITGLFVWQILRFRPFAEYAIPFLFFAGLFLSIIYLVDSKRRKPVTARILLLCSSVFLVWFIADIVMILLKIYKGSDTEYCWVGGPEEYPRKQRIIHKDRKGIIYDVIVTTDKYARRLSAHQVENEARKHCICFGCSWVFGWGVQDFETMPARLGKITAGYNVYNYGKGGTGANDTLYRISRPSFLDEIPEKEGKCIYWFLDAHIFRSAGTIRSVANWAASAPCYELDESGDPQYLGTFAEARPVTTWLFRILATSPIAFMILDRVSENASEGDIKLCGGLISDIISNYHSRFRGEFHIMFAPGSKYTDKIMNELKDCDADFIQLSKIEYNTDEKLRIPREGHPSALMHSLVAEIVKEKITDK
ncbi:MAG: hypothetical protein ACYS8W_12590 [Planctomycetota bacterium]|jgi:hypothetical protein